MLRHILYCIVVSGLLAAAVPFAHAQSDAPEDSVTWTRNLTGNLSGSQAAYKDWQEGGLNSLSLSTSISGRAERSSRRWGQTHELRLTFGFINQEEEEFRKSEDLIRLQSSFRYKGNGFFRVLNPTIAANLRTQFAKGFDYSGNPFPSGTPQANEDAPVQTSAFFSPAFFIESLGLTYEPAEWYSMRLAAATKQTVVLNEDLRVLYDVDLDKAARVEAGAEFAAALNREIAENVRYTSNFNAFFSFNQTDDPPDFIWENVFTMKVNSWLSTQFEFVALFDKNTTDAIQLKEVLSLGVSFVLI